MDPILSILLCWQLIFFGLAIAAIVFVVRTIVEYFQKNKEAKLWNKLILPVLPIISGGVVGRLLKSFPYPDGLTHYWDRVIFGMVAGLLSTFMYRMIKNLMFKKNSSIPIINVIINEKTETTTTTTTTSKSGGNEGKK